VSGMYTDYSSLTPSVLVRPPNRKLLPWDIGPSTGSGWESANAAAEKDNPWRSSYERAIGRKLKGPLGVESLDRRQERVSSPLAPDYDERTLGIASARERTTVTCRRMKPVCDERERIPLPTRDATMTMMQYIRRAAVTPNTEADPVALGSPQTKYRLVIGKEQTPLQERTSGEVRESGNDMGRSYTWTPMRPKRISDPRTQPISTQSRRELRESTPANLREPTLANLRRIRANAALRSRPIENDPRYADVECQDEEFSRCDAG
jgi:hypothetical protein